MRGRLAGRLGDFKHGDAPGFLAELEQPGPLGAGGELAEFLSLGGGIHGAIYAQAGCAVKMIQAADAAVAAFRSASHAAR